MINAAKIDFEHAKDVEISAEESNQKRARDPYRRLLSVISILNNRSEEFELVVVITTPSSRARHPVGKQLQILLESLTKREMEVYQLAIKGLPNRIIAEKLFIGIETVKSHRKNIVAKAGVTKIDEIKTWILEAHNLIDG